MPGLVAEVWSLGRRTNSTVGRVSCRTSLANSCCHSVIRGFAAVGGQGREGVRGVGTVHVEPAEGVVGDGVQPWIAGDLLVRAVRVDVEAVVAEGDVRIREPVPDVGVGRVAVRRDRGVVVLRRVGVVAVGVVRDPGLLAVGVRVRRHCPVPALRGHLGVGVEVVQVGRTGARGCASSGRTRHRTG